MVAAAGDVTSETGCYMLPTWGTSAGSSSWITFGVPPGITPLGSTSGLPPQGSHPLGSAPWISLLGPPPGPPRGTPPPGCFRWVHSLGPVPGSPSWVPHRVSPLSSPPRVPRLGSPRVPTLGPPPGSTPGWFTPMGSAAPSAAIKSNLLAEGWEPLCLWVATDEYEHVQRERNPTCCRWSHES